MRKRLILAASVGLLVLAGEASAIVCPLPADPNGNLLANPGIEFCGIDGAGDNAVPFGWQMNESIIAEERGGVPDPNQTESLAEGAFYGHRRYTGDGGNDITPTPRYWNMWFKPYVGTFVEVGGVPQENNFAHLFQDVPGTPGMKYTMTGYAAFEPFFAGGVTNLNWDPNNPGPGPESPDPNNHTDGFASPTNMYFALEFLDSSENVLAGSVEIELFDEGQLPTGAGFWTNVNWTLHTLVGIAPPGTVEVRVRASMLDGVLNPIVDPQSAFVDAFTLTAEEVAGLPGDFDLDLDVDGIDFLKWQRGETPGNGSPAELVDWEVNYGTDLGPLVGVVTAVPEPAAAISLSLGVMCAMLRTFARGKKLN